MADIKWIKLDVDMFNNSKIKRIRRLPEGNNILLIWIMLLTMAGKCNACGMIFITQNILYTVDDLADELGFSVDTVKLALSALDNLGMICCENGEIEVVGWTEHQSEAALSTIREAERERKAAYREKQKNIKKLSGTCPGQVHGLSYSISNSISISNSSFSKDNKNKDIITNIVNYLNNKLNSNYKVNSKNTVKHINARLSEGFLEEEFYSVIDKMYDRWHSDKKMAQYLRPETLFGTKFESYLNMPEAVEQSEMQGWMNELEKAKNVPNMEQNIFEEWK